MKGEPNNVATIEVGARRPLLEPMEIRELSTPGFIWPKMSGGTHPVLIENVLFHHWSDMDMDLVKRFESKPICRPIADLNTVAPAYTSELELLLVVFEKPEIRPVTMIYLPSLMNSLSVPELQLWPEFRKMFHFFRKRVVRQRLKKVGESQIGPPTFR